MLLGGGGHQVAGHTGGVGDKLGQSSYVAHIVGDWALDVDICEGRP
jgi:hypothetical protein